MHKGDLILFALSGGKKYGLELQEAIVSATGEKFSVGSLYPFLRRLEEGGLIAGKWGGNESPGARRRYYSLTKKGRDEVMKMEKTIAALKGEGCLSKIATERAIASADQVFGGE